MAIPGWTGSTLENRLRWLGGGAFVLAGLLALSFFVDGTHGNHSLLGFDAWLVVGTFKIAAGALLLLDGFLRSNDRPGNR